MLRIPLLVLAAAASAFPFADAGGQVERLPVLMYHHLVTDEPESDAELHVDCFQKQMQFLHEHGYATLTLEEFERHHAQGAFPERSLLITFDDGYRSFLEHAYPLLRTFGFSSVVFPVVGLMPGLQRHIVFVDHLSFHEIRLMESLGGRIDVGSHTYDLHDYGDAEHAMALRQPGESVCDHHDRVRRDLLTSKLLLEAQTDREIDALAWPYGITTEALVDVAAEVGFALQFTTDVGYVTAATPLTALPRFNVAAGPGPCFREVVEQTLD